MLKKNFETTVVVENIGMNGEGIAKIDKYVIFIPFALTGEKVKIRILKVVKNIAYARVLEICTPADERDRPKCNVFGRCGGCQLQHLKYLSQLRVKGKTVKDCFCKIANINVDVPMPQRSDFIYGYRNKLQIPVGMDNCGNTHIGFFAENSHRIVPIESCAIHPDWSTQIIAIIRSYIDKFNVSGYHEMTKSGALRHIVVREIGGKFIIGLIATQKLPSTDYLVEEFSKVFKVFSLFVNYNKKETNIIFGDEYDYIYGPKTFEEEEFGIKYLAGAQTFLQVNPYVMRRLYDKVIKSCDDGIVIDAYSGAGLLSAMIARRAEFVYGIEVVKQAFDCAQELTQLNNLSCRMKNICGKVEDNLEQVVNEIGAREFTLVLDPPRKGCELSVIQTVLKANPKKIIYISCNPATLARDIGLLCGTLEYVGKNLTKTKNQNSNYSIEYLQPYDMFPQTKHIETLVCLCRNK